MWANYSENYTLDPLPDELFFSTVSRTAHLLNHRNLQKISLHFFNHHHRRPASVIPVNNYKNPMEVFNHCVGSYYMASYSLKRQKVLINNIFNFKGPNFIGIFKTGRNDSFLTKTDLFVCPVCLKADLEKYGMPYFHLSHQYEGVNACPKHGVKLFGYNFNNGYEIFPLIKLDNYKKPEEADKRDKLYSRWALDFHNFSHEYLSMVYRSIALEKDLSLLNKRKLYKELEDFFGYEFLYQCNCSKEQTSRGNEKILGLLNPTDRPTHPYYHFMMWEFLGLSPENFTEPTYAIKGKKLIPIPKPGDLDKLKLIKEDLGKKVYFSENINKEVVEYFPIDLKQYLKLV